MLFRSEKLTQLTPNSAKANLVHADALTATKSIEKAIAAYTKAITLKPDYIEALNNRGTAYFNYLKNPTAALADFDRAIALAPKQGLYYLNRANCYFSLGDKPKALQSALQAQRLGQAVRPEFLENLK